MASPSSGTWAPRTCLFILALSACAWKRALPAPDAFVDRDAYPFDSQWIPVDGGRVLCVDEGEGPVVLLVHGTSVWSFVWRDLMDHVGLGLSDKPADGSYTPQAHADHGVRLVEQLDLHGLTLVVHDLGGPIGLCAGRELARGGSGGAPCGRGAAG